MQNAYLPQDNHPSDDSVDPGHRLWERRTYCYTDPTHCDDFFSNSDLGPACADNFAPNSDLGSAYADNFAPNSDLGSAYAVTRAIHSIANS